MTQGKKEAIVEVNCMPIHAQKIEWCEVHSGKPHVSTS